MAEPTKRKPYPLDIDVSPIGPRLSHLRKLSGYSRNALAELMGISRKQVTDHETGRVHLNDEMIVLFAIALQITSDSLLCLKYVSFQEVKASVRFTERSRALQQPPEARTRAIIKVLDELIRTDEPPSPQAGGSSSRCFMSRLKPMRTTGLSRNVLLFPDVFHRARTNRRP